MHDVVERLIAIRSEIKELLEKNNSQNQELNIIVVSKTFTIDKILPLIDSGHVHFGENKVQEAELKWKEIKKKYSHIKLHMIGKLQTNKVKSALSIFDYIHSVDNYKLAEKIAKHQNELGKSIKVFVQVNVGEESQKNGIQPESVNEFIKKCKDKLSLNIIGLMCIPPFDLNSQHYFKLLKKTADELHLKELSMGMSLDYENAVVNGATYLRLGTAILGERNFN